MKRLPCHSVILLTFVFLCLTACSSNTLFGNSDKNTCKNSAYVRFPISDYINTQYHSFPQLRLAIIPFSGTANFARSDSFRPSIGSEIVSKLQAELLASHKISIVEIFNTGEWSGKYEDFDNGNHKAINLAHTAGYDLLLVGRIEPLKALSEFSASARLIDVNSGVTIWYGHSKIGYRDFPTRHGDPFFIFDTPRPDNIPITSMVDKLSFCLTRNILSEEPVP